MSASPNFIYCLVLGIVLSTESVFTQAIDCQRPPQLVDPALCCRDGGRDQVSEKCAQRIVGGAANGQQPSLETATCLAECILSSSNYMEGQQKLNLANIRNDLSRKFSNDSLYVEAMTTAYTSCEPQARRRLAALPQTKHQCSPFSAILLGCTYMEYFKNCPAHRWTQNADCALAKTFVTQCGLGA